LLVEVVSSSADIEYELDEDDVRIVFEKFGKVSSVEVDQQSNKAVVVIEDARDGYDAEKYLNFYKLTDSSAYLTVKWQFGDFDSLQKSALMLRESSKKLEQVLNDNENDKAEELKQENLIKSSSGNEVEKILDISDDSKLSLESSCSPEKIKMGVNTQCTSLSKFTCKYEIPLKNLPGFSVARKIIGYRGKNMKSILDKLKDKHFSGPIQEVIKLRLRGKGSGYKEGPDNCESDEPLHLCVSSQYFEKYTEACKLAEILLKDTYREYNNFCRSRGRPTKNYKIIKMENSPACFLSNYSNKAQQ